jgi:ribonuclease BN (tRNA processing enzyme)
LIAAVRRLADKVSSGALLLDSPGVVRGVAGSELLQGLIEVAAVDMVLAITTPGRPPPLAKELAAVSVEYHQVQAAFAARRPGKRARARSRSAQWDLYLSGASEQEIDLDRLLVIGTPPPQDEPDAWSGRQIALLREARCVAVGEVMRLTAGRLTLRAPQKAYDADTLLVRDATRGSEGLLQSAVPFAATRWDYLPPADLVPDRATRQGPRPVGRIGGVDVALVNGLFGDPLLHVRLRHRPRSLLFDLGDGSRLSARVAHQVSDVFISHAHMDHLSGFVWLLRSRIGAFPACRLYGPPGLARNISGLIQGFLWDRAGERSPVFEISELHGDTLQRFRLQAGGPARELPEARSVADGIVHAEPGFRVRAITLDHHTPVLAYAFEPDRELNVRKDSLQRCGLSPGPWLNELKQRLIAGDEDMWLSLPGGSAATVAELARELLTITPGKRLVYATDLADTPSNRKRLVGLARNAHTLFLEAVFAEADVAHARDHGHLTARACGEIAAAAGVSRLVPFHFSRRYADNPLVLFDEIEAVCGRVVLPGPQALSGAAQAGVPEPENVESDYRID